MCEGVRSVPCVRSGSLGTSDGSTASCVCVSVCGVCVCVSVCGVCVCVSVWGVCVCEVNNWLRVPLLWIARATSNGKATNCTRRYLASACYECY